MAELAFNPQTGEAVYLNESGQWVAAPSAKNPKTGAELYWNGKDWQPREYSWGETAIDAAKGAATGLAKGVMGVAGIPGALNDLAGFAVTTAGDAIGLPRPPADKRPRVDLNPPSPADLRARVESATGPLYEPKTTTGKVAGTVAEFTPLGLGMAAPAIKRGAEGVLPAFTKFAAAPGVASELAGEATQGTFLETPARVGAAIAGGLGASMIGQAVQNVTNPALRAATDLSRAILRDGETPADVAARAIAQQGLKPGVATIADAGGGNVQGLLERIANTPGAGRGKVVPSLMQAQKEQMSRVASDLRDLTGAQQTAFTTLEKTMAARKAAADPLYKQAFNFNARAEPDIVQAWTDVTSTGWGKAVLESKQFKRNLQTEYGLADAQQAPLMVQIDAWKKAVDDVINPAKQKGKANQVRVLTDMKNDLIGVVDQHNPAYAAARKAWESPTKFMDAIEEGRSLLFNQKVSAEELAANFGKMSAAEQEAFRIGAVSAIVGKMGNDAAKLADMTKFVRSPEMRAKIEAIMPDAQAAQQWIARLEFEIGKSELTGKALTNSATARRLAERADAEGLVPDLIAQAFSASPIRGILRSVIGAAPKAIRDTLRSKTDSALADILLEANNPARMGAALGQAQRAAIAPPVGRQVGVVSSEPVLSPEKAAQPIY